MKDRFSKQAAGYAAFRPTYPAEFYNFLMDHVSSKVTAWDCGTGNGQVARDLAPRFKEIFATDTSIEQIKKAVAQDNVYYSVAAAEQTGFPKNSFDLITVGQAIHWFRFDEFYAEVRRVAKKNALLAIWGYGLLQIEPSIDTVILDFYSNVIGPFWDPERRYIDEHYRTIPFPFHEIPSRQFTFSFSWSLPELEGYLNTWSAVQKFILANGTNPVDVLIMKMRPMWRNEKMTVSFPLFMRMGRVEH
jgi:SAM-dependent methyltransferase